MARLVALVALSHLVLGSPHQLIFTLPSSTSFPLAASPSPSPSPFPNPYCQVGQPCFPDENELERFNKTVEGALQRVLPAAAVCYAGPQHDANACAALPAELGNPFFRRQTPASLQYTNWETSSLGLGCPLPPSNVSSPPPLTGCKSGDAPGLVVDLGLVEAKQGHWWKRGKERHEVVVEVVQKVVRLVKDKHLRFRIKNTGHDYVGRSSGAGSLVLLTSSLNTTSYHPTFLPSSCSSLPRPPPKTRAIEVGAGVINQALYKAAEDAGVGTVGGASRTVGVGGGIVGGGGHGPLSRTWGMVVDNVVQYELVTADGKLRNASLCENADLFWAMRGGGAGTWGVVLRVWIKVHDPLKGVAGFFGTLKAADPDSWAKVIKTLMELMPDLDRRGIAGYAETLNPSLALAFVHPFPNSTANSTIIREAFRPLTDLIDKSNGTVQGKWSTVELRSWYKFWSGPLQDAFGPLDATGVNLLLGSRLVPRDVVEDKKQRQALTTFLTGLHSPAIVHLVAGGAVSSFEGRSVALNPAWRDALLHIDLPAVWPALSPLPTGPTEYVAGLQKISAYVSSITAALGNVTSAGGTKGASYFNEADADERHWQDVFFGKDHYVVLKRIKEKYDPEGVFTCRKCVGSETFGF